MPYSNPDAQRAYQREWIAKRRQEWFADKACLDCGTTIDLQLDHLDPRQKVSHRIWSWAEKRRAAELAKCVVRCRPCHLTKTILLKEQGHPGETNPNARYDVQTIQLVRQRVASGERQSDVARDLGINRKTVWEIVHRKWTHVA